MYKGKSACICSNGRTALCVKALEFAVEDEELVYIHEFCTLMNRVEMLGQQEKIHTYV